MRGNRKGLLLFMVIGMAITIMSACGAKSEESVLKDIEEKSTQITKYQMAAEMVMNTGEKERNYHVNVKYKKGDDDFLRVDLANDVEEDKQVILKNEEGVFVLTPALKKSFKFRTEWPNESSQPYLYQSIIKDVLKDEDANFTEEEDSYIFITDTNYKNNNQLPRQKVTFDKKTLLPKTIHVLDDQDQPLITVNFKKVDLDPVFEDTDFQREKIMENGAKEKTDTESVASEVLEVLFPMNTLGAELTKKEEVTLENGERVIMTFTGTKNFTLVQEQKGTQTVANMVGNTEEVKGDIVHLGHSIGAVSDHTISWNYEGVDYLIASDDMSTDELVSVASSVQGKGVK